jgi:hypothetical protein
VLMLRGLCGCQWMFFLVLLNGAVLVGVLCLIVRGVWRCVQSGQACCCLGEEKERYLVVKACVCVGGYDWRCDKLSIKCTYRFGGEIRSRSRSSGCMAREVPIAAWCGILGVNDTTLLQVAGMVLRAGLEQRRYGLWV